MATGTSFISVTVILTVAVALVKGSELPSVVPSSVTVNVKLSDPL